jgi:hypothetical protein
MKLRMLAVAMVCTLLSVMVSETAEAQRGRGYHGGGNGYYGGRGNGNYGNNRGNCGPRYAAPRAYYNRGYNNCAPRYSRQVYYNNYNNCGPRYVRVRPSCPPPRYNNYGGGYGNGYYGGNGGGVSVNVNTPGFSGSWNRW